MTSAVKRALRGLSVAAGIAIGLSWHHTPRVAEAQARVASGWQASVAVIDPLTVLIDAGEKPPCLGTGIIVGHRDGRAAYVVTAWHVVKGISTEPSAMRVRWTPAGAGAKPQRFAAKLLQHDQAGDLAVLEVSEPAFAGAVAKLRFDLAGDAAHLRARDQVYFTGCREAAAGETAAPGASAATAPASDGPDIGPVQRRTGPAEPGRIYVERKRVELGLAGGPAVHVMGKFSAIVGMTVLGEPRAPVLTIESLIERLRAWNVPVALRAPFTDKDCTYTISAKQNRLVMAKPDTLWLTAYAGSRVHVMVETGANCQWSVETDLAPWVGVFTASNQRARVLKFTGPGEVLFGATRSNQAEGADPRNAAIRVAGHLLHVAQDSSNVEHRTPAPIVADRLARR